ncbi:unnamed protein product, partial [Rotaria magnacalcarata]
MDGLGLEVAMPPFLDGRRQFPTNESNQSRCITKVRWIVEAKHTFQLHGRSLIDIGRQ